MNNETAQEKTVHRVVHEAWRMHEEDKRFYAELDSESHRGAAILAAEYFDHRLRKAIKEKYSTLDKELWHRCEQFPGNDRKSWEKHLVGPSPWMRIRIAYLLGLYDKETMDRLDDVIKIRNHFAHPSMSKPLDFNTQCVAEECSKFPLQSVPDPDSQRNRYIQFLTETGDSIWSTLMELRTRTDTEQA